jgi:uncharacterized protein (DUF4213/DUF364 family)
MSSPWDLYDELLAAIPEDLLIEDCLIGVHWVLVRSVGVGMAMSPSEGRRHSLGEVRGRPVREIAQAAKSWNFLEAAVGMAALNSWHNAPAVLERTFLLGESTCDGKGALEDLAGRAGGRKVAVIGHFPGVEALSERCELSVLERRPSPGDFPDPACEYLLPHQDAVLATGTTLMNKTLPRLLELSRKAEFVLTGPTTTLSPTLFAHGVDLLAGTMVTDVPTIWRHVAEGGDRSVFRNGARMVRLSREDVA